MSAKDSHVDAALAGAVAGTTQEEPNERPRESEFERHVLEDRKTRKRLERVKFDKLDEYLRAGKLGEGTYGLVVKGFHRPTDTPVALKKIKPDIEELGIPPTTIREISLLEELSQHPYIVTFYCTIFNQSNIYLVFEYVEYDLRKYMDDKLNEDADSGLPVEQAKRFQFQLCRAIEFCHKNRVFHRDLKPQNILVSSDGDRIKIADFGLAREHGLPVGKLTREVVTLWYRPPEVLMGSDNYNGGIDTWALGCILWEMLSGSALFPADCEIDAIFKIFCFFGTPNGARWPEWRSLPNWQSKFPKFKPKDLREELEVKISDAGIEYLQGLLTMDPVLRMNSLAAAEHRWLNEP